MMDRDDISVGVGGEGGISNDSKIHPDVGGYLPLIDQVSELFFASFEICLHVIFFYPFNF